jgi:hypothetical protein
MTISTRDLSQLPDPTTLEKRTKSLAMLDAIMSPEWDYRYFSFNAHWDAKTGDRMASMRNGSGDEYFLLFTAHGAILKGFDHESVMSPWIRANKSVWVGVLDHVPDEFASFLTEPAFSMKDTTFCVWRKLGDSAWHVGPISFPEGKDPDGSEKLLWALDGSSETYLDFARDYFELSPDLKGIESVFQHQPLTRELVAKLNSDKDFSECMRDAEEIGYNSDSHA